jgi:dihydroneopterin aldolase
VDGVGDDRIELRALQLTALVGVLHEERERVQPIELDLDVVVPLVAAGASDDLADTVDYGRVCAVVGEVVAAGHVALLEHLAERVAAEVLAVDDRITSVVVAVRKLRPPVPQALATSGVRISRSR